MSDPNPPANIPASRPWYQRVGPGLITACVVIGPGSILTSSKVGAEHGFSMLWVVAVAVLFMMVYTSLGAKLGVAASQSPGDLVAQRAGRWLAVLIGIGVFFISAAFQSGNNLGVYSAINVYFDFDYAIVIFNVVAIAFLFAFKNLYRAVERLMMALVGLMLISFAVNLAFAGPDLGQLAKGFIPRFEEKPNIELLGLVGTTFVISASYFQAYLVRQKGWGSDQLADGMRDARIGALIMAAITLMLMSTAAAVLTEKPETVEQVAEGLKPLFNAWGKPIFCLGLFAAAFSSFLVNSMIGGFILSDGLGLGSKPTDLGPKLCTTLVLLSGMGVAMIFILTIDPETGKGWSPVGAIVTAQALTILASPLMAGTLLWLTNRRDVMGEHVNGRWTNVLAASGFLMLLAMGVYVAKAKVLPAVKAWLEL